MLCVTQSNDIAIAIIYYNASLNNEINSKLIANYTATDTTIQM